MEEKIKYIFIEFPEDGGGPGAGEGKHHLDWKRNFANELLGVSDRDAIEIGDHNRAEEMRGNIY